MPSLKKCMKCLNHGVQSTHATSDCSLTNCRKCVLLEERRLILKRLSVDLVTSDAMKMADDKCETSRYTCSKCRRHGIVVPKKFHEPCPFTLCQCEICALTVRKGEIDRELASIARAGKTGELFLLDALPDTMLLEPEMVTSQTESIHSPEVQVILDLLTLLTTTEEPDNFDSIDFDALKSLLSMPTIDLPTDWMPHMSVITELVYIAMAKLPCFYNFDFQRVPFLN